MWNEIHRMPQTCGGTRRRTASARRTKVKQRGSEGPSRGSMEILLSFAKWSKRPEVMSTYRVGCSSNTRSFSESAARPRMKRSTKKIMRSLAFGVLRSYCAYFFSVRTHRMTFFIFYPQLEHKKSHTKIPRAPLAYHTLSLSLSPFGRPVASLVVGGGQAPSAKV